MVELLKEFYPNRTAEGKNVKVYKIVFSIIRSVWLTYTDCGEKRHSRATRRWLVWTKQRNNLVCVGAS